MHSNTLVLMIVIGILYFVARNYMQNNYHTIRTNKKELFEGDLLQHEAGIIIALLAKVAKADGKVCELEAQLFKHTLDDIATHFDNAPLIRQKLKAIYTQEKQTFDNTFTLAKRYAAMTKNYHRKLKLLEYLLNMAFIDGILSEAEIMITEDIASALGISQNDFTKLLESFRQFYNTQQNKTISLTKAYAILESTPQDSLETIKKNYRRLVKKHHPDIIEAQGGDASIIELATKKLQEINEAYEQIKKDKNG